MNDLARQPVPANTSPGANLPVVRNRDGTIDELGTLGQRLAAEPAENIPAIVAAMGELRAQAERERDGHTRRRREMIDTVGNLAMSAGSLATGVAIGVFADDTSSKAFGYFFGGIGGFRVAA